MRSGNTFKKKMNEANKRTRKQDKADKKEERQKNSKGGGLENMLAYVDENGNISSEPPKTA